MSDVLKGTVKWFNDQKGYGFISPEEGFMACGEEGIGRLPETQIISQFVLRKLYKKNTYVHSFISHNNKLKDLKVIVTAGPTQERIDPVRFISNNSSGKQGYAIAEEFKKNGAQVTLITGPTKINVPINSIKYLIIMYIIYYIKIIY